MPKNHLDLTKKIFAIRIIFFVWDLHSLFLCMEFSSLIDFGDALWRYIKLDMRLIWYSWYFEKRSNVQILILKHTNHFWVKPKTSVNSDEDLTTLTTMAMLNLISNNYRAPLELQCRAPISSAFGMSTFFLFYL